MGGPEDRWAFIQLCETRGILSDGAQGIKSSINVRGGMVGAGPNPLDAQNVRDGVVVQGVTDSEQPTAQAARDDAVVQGMIEAAGPAASSEVVSQPAPAPRDNSTLHELLDGIGHSREGSKSIIAHQAEQLPSRPQQSGTAEMGTLLEHRISAADLAKILVRPSLPQSHLELEALLGHLRHLAAQLEGRGGRLSGGAGSLQALEREIADREARLHERRCELGVQRSRIPAPWSVSPQLWQDLFGESLPEGATCTELQELASKRLRELRGEVCRKVDEAEAQVSEIKTNTERILLEAAAKEAEAKVLDAERDLLVVECQQQAQRAAELQAKLKQRAAAGRRLSALDEAEKRQHMQNLQIQHYALKIQREWRKHREKAKKKARAIIRIVIFVRTWRRRRLKAARKIQSGWRARQKRLVQTVKETASGIVQGVGSAIMNPFRRATKKGAVVHQPALAQ